LTEHSVEVQEVLKLDRRMLPSLTELKVNVSTKVGVDNQPVFRAPIGVPASA
jgi:hypothetical protein